MTQTSSISGSRPGVERPHLFWWAIILFGMTLTGVLAYNDAAYGMWAENVTTLLPQGLIQWIFVVAVGIHVTEALVALRMASRNADKAGSPFGWFIQTLLLGYASLGLLRKRLGNA